MAAKRRISGMPRRAKHDETVPPTLVRREDRGRFVELEDEEE